MFGEASLQFLFFSIQSCLPSPTNALLTLSYETICICMFFWCFIVKHYIYIRIDKLKDNNQMHLQKSLIAYINHIWKITSIYMTWILYLQRICRSQASVADQWCWRHSRSVCEEVPMFPEQSGKGRSVLMIDM